MWIRILVEEQGRRPVRLWIPLFLLWPLLLFLFVLLLPVVLLILAVALFIGKLRQVLMIGRSLYEVICCAKGLEVNVENEWKGERVIVRVV